MLFLLNENCEIERNYSFKVILILIDFELNGRG